MGCSFSTAFAVGPDAAPPRPWRFLLGFWGPAAPGTAPARSSRAALALCVLAAHTCTALDASRRRSAPSADNDTATASWSPCPSSEGGTVHDGVPNTIWSFWSDPAYLPKAVQLARASWRFFAPDYEVRVLHAGNWRDFLTDAQVHRGRGPGENVTALTRDNRFADWLRVVLLAEHGGVWIDASIVLSAPLELLIHPDAQISGVHLSGMLFETYFIAAARGSRTMRRWRGEFERICSMSASDYESYLLRLHLNGIEGLNGQFSACSWADRSRAHAAVYWAYEKVLRFVNSFAPTSHFYLHLCGEGFWMRYLNLHVALNSVLGTNGTAPTLQWETHGVCVQDSGETLSRVSAINGWTRDRVSAFLMTQASKDYDLTATRGIKLRSGDRKAVEDLGSCEKGSAICRIQELVGLTVFPMRDGAAHEL